MTEQRPTDPPPVIAYARPTLNPPPPSRLANGARAYGYVGIGCVCFAIAMGMGSAPIVMLVFAVIGVICSLVAIVTGLVAVIGRHHGRRVAISGIVLGVLTILPVGFAMAVIAPMMLRAHTWSRQAVCQSNLMSIGKMLMLYKTDNRDVHPPDLPMMATSGYGPLPRCPDATGGQAGGYFYYRPSAAEDVPGSAIVACDFKRNHAGQGRSVLHNAGNVGWMVESDFQAELARPENVDFAKSLRTAEGQ